MVQAVRDMDADEFIVATDRGIFHKMRQLAPGKRLIEAPTAGKSATCRSCAHCPWMAMNSLTALLHALETGASEIHVDPAVGARARLPIERMLDFTRRQKLQSAGDA
jgi:quinolinate synthase